MLGNYFLALPTIKDNNWVYSWHFLLMKRNSIRQQKKVLKRLPCHHGHCHVNIVIPVGRRQSWDPWRGRSLRHSKVIVILLHVRHCGRFFFHLVGFNLIQIKFFSSVFNTYHSIWLFQIITVVADSTDHYISNWKCWENLMIFAFCFFMAQSCNLTGCFWTEGVGSNGVLLARIVKRFYCLLLFLFIKWSRVIKKGCLFLNFRPFLLNGPWSTLYVLKRWKMVI